MVRVTNLLNCDSGDRFHSVLVGVGKDGEGGKVEIQTVMTQGEIHCD